MGLRNILENEYFSAFCAGWFSGITGFHFYRSYKKRNISDLFKNHFELEEDNVKTTKTYYVGMGFCVTTMFVGYGKALLTGELDWLIPCGGNLLSLVYEIKKSE